MLEPHSTFSTITAHGYNDSVHREWSGRLTQDVNHVGKPKVSCYQSSLPLKLGDK